MRRRLGRGLNPDVSASARAGAWRAALAPAAAAPSARRQLPSGFSRDNAAGRAILPFQFAVDGAPAVLPGEAWRTACRLPVPSSTVGSRTRTPSTLPAGCCRRAQTWGRRPLQCPPSVSLGPLDRLDLRVRVAGPSNVRPRCLSALSTDSTFVYESPAPPMSALGVSRPSRPTRPSCTSRRPLQCPPSVTPRPAKVGWTKAR